MGLLIYAKSVDGIFHRKQDLKLWFSSPSKRSKRKGAAMPLPFFYRLNSSSTPGSWAKLWTAGTPSTFPKP